MILSYGKIWMMDMNQRIPKGLHTALLAMLVAIGAGGGAYIGESSDALTPYLQAAADDESTSDAIKVAIVLGSYFESGFRHIGKPYVDKLGKEQPLTVCNGLTGSWIDPSKYYSPQECYSKEIQYYKTAETQVSQFTHKWNDLTVLQQASILDFVHNKGIGAYSSSTMLKLLNQGKIQEACRQNERWVKGTVKGVSVVLPGLQVRANANSDLCAEGL